MRYSQFDFGEEKGSFFESFDYYKNLCIADEVQARSFPNLPPKSRKKDLNELDAPQFQTYC